MDNDKSLAAACLDETFRAFRGYKRLADNSLAQIDDKAFFYLPDPESNSIAVLVKHIAGNLRSRWTDFLTTDGEKPDRNRDQEFVLTPADTREDLMRRWEASFETVFSTIRGLKPEDVSRTVYIRNEPHTVLQAMMRSVTHVSHHIGQIVFLAKHLRGADWNTLSIPKGKSAEYNATKPEDRKVKAPARN
jgi:uncharacterized damage-inducible protein DinB